MAGVYETCYGLSSDPFRLSPDHRFAYAHPSYRKARACMRYALRRGEGFLVVTGTPGTGKTTLIQETCARIADARITLVSLLSTRLQPDDLLDMVAIGLGIARKEADGAGPRSQIEMALVRQRRSQRRVVLMVDEAQDLSAGALEELRLLSDMGQASRLPLQVFLVGQDPLVELIERPGMDHVRQRIVAAAHLRPLCREATAAFVIHRLERAGWQGDPGITPQALASVHAFSRGVPRLINQLGSRLLFFGAVEGKHILDSGDVERVIDGLRAEMRFGGAVAEPATDGCRHAPEHESAMGRQARASPAGFALPERPLRPRDLDVASAAVLPLPSLSDPLPGRYKDLASPFPAPGVRCARAAGRAGRREPPALAGPRRYVRRPRWRQASFAGLLLVLTVIGFQLRLSGGLAVQEPLSRASEEMAAFTVLPVPGGEPSQAAAAFADPLQAVASGQQALRDGSRERNEPKPFKPHTVPDDGTAPGVSAPISVAVLPGDSSVSATTASYPIRNRLQAAADGKSAAEPPAAPWMVLETASAQPRSMSAPDPTEQSAMRNNRPAKNPGEADVSGFDMAKRRYQPEEVRAWLMSGQWTRYGEPTARLPSPVTRCRSRPDYIVCWSVPQKFAAGSRAGIYQVQASIDGFSGEGSFRVRYRVMESVLQANDPGPPAAVRKTAVSGPAVRAQKTACTAVDSTLIRCGGAVDAVFRLGWTVSGQDTTCSAIGSTLIRCRGAVEGVFRLGWKLSEAEMTCRAIDSSLIRCRDDEGGVYAYQSAR